MVGILENEINKADTMLVEFKGQLKKDTVEFVEASSKAIEEIKTMLRDMRMEGATS